jgi:hypothetical protein
MMDDEVTPEASAICVLLSHIEAVFAERGYLDCDISDEAYDELNAIGINAVHPSMYLCMDL